MIRSEWFEFPFEFPFEQLEWLALFEFPEVSDSPAPADGRRDTHTVRILLI